VIYLDADTVIRQPGFDIRTYLKKRSKSALIAAPASPGAEKWNINNGIFFINLGSYAGQEIARRWQQSFHDIVTDNMLREAVEPWQRLRDGSYFPDDQHLLQVIIRDDPGLLDHVAIEASGLINSGGGRFIQQIMRHSGSIEERLTSIRVSVARIEAGA